MTDAAPAIEGGRSEQVRRVVERIEGLPTLPTVLAQMNRMMLDPKTTAKDMAQLLASDPAVTSRILKVVNSAFYGFPSRISTISHAIVILGFSTVKSIVLSSTIFETFGGKGGDPRFRREDFWKHSLACGASCKVIARASGESVLEEFFIAGLLHDIGKIIEDNFLRDDFQRIRRDVEDRKILYREAEEACLGVNHAEIAGWLFQKWKLSKGLVASVSCHHNPALADEHVKAASIVHLGDIAARALQRGNGGDEGIPAISQVAWDALGLKAEDLPELLKECDREYARGAIFLEFVKS